MNKITNITPEVNEALICHQQIVQSGRVAASALIDMGKGLKKMRDGKLYERLGYESFREYVENNGDYSFKERQAYTYIKAVETFSDKFLTENGDLGITKLGMLSVLGESEAAEVIECHELSGLTSEEVKALVKEKQALGEQLSFWQEEAKNAKEDAENLAEDVEKLEKERKKAEKLEEQIKKLKDKHKKEIGELNAQINKRDAEIEMIKTEQAASAEPTEEQKKAIAAEYEKQIEELKQAAQAAEEEKKKIEDKLKNGSVDEMRAAMKVYFTETQKAIKTFVEKLSEIPDPETKNNYTSGTVKWLQSIINELVPL